MSVIRSPVSVQEQSPGNIIGTRLGEMSARLVAEWSSADHSHLEGSAEKYLSNQALRAHIPIIIGSIGRFVRDPAFELRQEMQAQLQANAGMWHQLDYGARDLTVWLDGLSQLIMQRMEQAVAQYAGDGRLAVAAFARLSEGLRAMSALILGQCLDTEQERHQESARQQADRELVLAHELRSPLHTISLSAAILETPGLGEDVDARRRQLKIIRASLAHAESLLQHVDLVGRSLDAQPRRFTATLGSVMQAVTEELSGRAMASGVELRLLNSEPLLAVENAVTYLILSNLVVNAIKYADHGKDRRWVTLRAEVTEGDDAGFVTVEVADNGLGIPMSLQQHVFQRRFRAHPQVPDGLGLGLAIVQDILLDRGGSIDLISQENVGTAVRFRLPTSPVDAWLARTRNAEVGAAG